MKDYVIKARNIRKKTVTIHIMDKKTKRTFKKYVLHFYVKREFEDSYFWTRNDIISALLQAESGKYINGKYHLYL